MKKCFLILCAAMLVISCSKEEELGKNDLNNVVVTGNLSDKVTGENISKITHLTISGTISGEDWNTLFEMATMGSLEVLDMTNAKIVGKSDVDWWNDDEIPEYEFSHSKTLKEVFLPNSLKVIGEEAFAECSKLALVHFPEGLDSIAPRAFYKSGLSGELSLPSRLRVIARQAFGWTKVNKVIINSNVIAGKTITQKESASGTTSDYSSIYAVGGNSVFAYCENLSEVVVKEGCTKLEIGFQHCSSLSTVVLPSTLLQIGHESGNNGNYVFEDCSSLSDISLPDNLLSIGYNAFAKTSLNEVAIPDNVQYLGTYAFHKCTQLKKINMSKQLKQIAHGCFEGCTDLVEIEIPDKVTEVDYKAFADCTSLKNVKFGNNIKTIGRNAFSGCILLQSAIMPSSLNTLRESAFEGCSNLVQVSLPDYLEEIESSTFKDSTELRDLYIGKSVLKIGSSSFYHCPKLKILDLPSSITQIDPYAFAYTGLKELSVSWSNPISIGRDIFDGLNLSKATLFVSMGTKKSFQQSAVWKDFGQIQER